MRFHADLRPNTNRESHFVRGNYEIESKHRSEFESLRSLHFSIFHPTTETASQALAASLVRGITVASRRCSNPFAWRDFLWDPAAAEFLLRFCCEQSTYSSLRLTIAMRTFLMNSGARRFDASQLNASRAIHTRYFLQNAKGWRSGLDGASVTGCAVLGWARHQQAHGRSAGR